MRYFNITVNGVGYQVSVDEVSGIAPVAVAPAAAPVAAAPVAAPVAAPAAPAAAPAPSAAPAVAADGTKVNAPMPGTILDIRCTVGAAVKKGDVLVILEAMKMENEIISPEDGTVQQIAVTKGATVNSGDVMVVIG